MRSQDTPLDQGGERKFSISMNLERATKNTYVYVEEDITAPKIGSLYVQKRSFKGKAPETIRASIEWDE